MFFALLRYCNAIATDVDFLLDGQIAYSDIHKRKSLSDELGCGTAFIVARQLFGCSEFLDFKTAVELNLVTTNAGSREQPDYCGLVPGTNRLVLLEAKGTQSGSEYCSSQQIPRGCDQVQNISLVSPVWSVVHRVAVGISLARTDSGVPTVIFVGDPPANHKYEFKIKEDSLAHILRCHYSRIGSLIGDGELLARSGAEQRSRVLPQLRTRTFHGIRFVGCSMQIKGPGYRKIQVFIGLNQQIRKLLLVQRTGWEQSLGNLKTSAPYESSRSTVFGSDGTVLSVEIG